MEESAFWLVNKITGEITRIEDWGLTPADFGEECWDDLDLGEADLVPDHATCRSIEVARECADDIVYHAKLRAAE